MPSSELPRPVAGLLYDLPKANPLESLLLGMLDGYTLGVKNLTQLVRNSSHLSPPSTVVNKIIVLLTDLTRSLLTGFTQFAGRFAQLEAASSQGLADNLSTLPTSPMNSNYLN